jgi:hypothetical protein
MGAAGLLTSAFLNHEPISNEMEIERTSESAKHKIVPTGRLTEIEAGAASAPNASVEMANSGSIGSLGK